MARIIRTTEHTVTANVPYHYICENCRKRNDQVAVFNGCASETLGSSYQHASGTLGVESVRDLNDYIQKTNEGLQECVKQLCSQKSGDPKQNVFSTFLFPFSNAVCVYCGKKPTWSGSEFTGEPQPSKKNSRKGCLIPVAGFVLAILLFVIAMLITTSGNKGPVADIIGFSGFGALFAGIVFYIIYRMRNRKSEKFRVEPGMNSAQINPDCFPIMDLQNINQPVPVPDEDKLAVPAEITIIRDSAAYLNGVTGSFRLNDKEIGKLMNGQNLLTTTHRKHNVLYATGINKFNSDMTTDFKPLVFAVESGTHAEIHFKSGKFLPDACTGMDIIGF